MKWIYEEAWRPTQRRALAVLAAGAAIASGCAKDSSSARSLAPPDAVPEVAQVGGGNLEVGVRLGSLRGQRLVGGFSISKYPTSVAEYERCVLAGACEAPRSDVPECALGHLGVDGATFETARGESESRAQRP